MASTGTDGDRNRRYDVKWRGLKKLLMKYSADEHELIHLHSMRAVGRVFAINVLDAFEPPYV